jgi:hypothetical protein
VLYEIDQSATQLNAGQGSSISGGFLASDMPALKRLKQLVFQDFHVKKHAVFWPRA